ncbi:unnamed protein product [Thelazia callipaeda]|uniref:4HBT domain-containing protein n=1 Tax=Thelazia callipaeda TaxID=103827 RepID=A0A0N5CX30_THECL|nr:unnamed protein product [Thelazia callipaeda]
MGKRKRSEMNTEIYSKKKKFQDNTNVEDTDLNAVDPALLEVRGWQNVATCSKFKVGMSRYVGLSYRKAKKIMASDTNCDLLLEIEKRHITLGWHLLGKAKSAISYILKCSLGQYRDSLNGVLLSIGKAKYVDYPLCIADQPCMHIDLNVHCIVFRPKKDHVYECSITAIDKKFITAKLYNTITFFAPIKDGKKCFIIREKVLIKFSHIEIKGSLCQMKGTIA